MVRIKEAIDAILDDTDHNQLTLANELGVTPPTISIWRNKNNDYCPRFEVAQRIWEKFDLQIYPYDKKALDGWD